MVKEFLVASKTVTVFVIVRNWTQCLSQFKPCRFLYIFFQNNYYYISASISLPSGAYHLDFPTKTLHILIIVKNKQVKLSL
jgi:hypothetical protein